MKQYKQRWLNSKILFDGKTFPSGFYSYSLFLSDKTCKSIRIMADNLKEADAMAREMFTDENSKCIVEVK